MNSFFSSTYYFWVTSRIVLAVALIVTGLTALVNDDIHSDEVVYNILGWIYILLLIVQCYEDFTGKVGILWIRRLTGIMSLIAAIACAWIGFFVGSTSTLLVIVSVWIVFLSLWDLLVKPSFSQQEEDDRSNTL